VVEEVDEALSILRTSCVVCCLLGHMDWSDHTLNECPRERCGWEDPDWQACRFGSIELPRGWCWNCWRPQVLIRHGLTLDIDASPRSSTLVVTTSQARHRNADSNAI
jgi:hypothetical protein